MNDYFNINRIEFFITKKCMAGCKHCSVPINDNPDECSYCNLAEIENTIKKLTEIFNIESSIILGGEPLLYIDNIAEICAALKKANIENIDLITSGFISAETTQEQIDEIGIKLSRSGIKRILLSADAFHQERIPLERIEFFINSCINRGFNNIILHPAWLISKDDINIYNVQTHRIVRYISSKYHVKISDGNYIIPSGTNKKHIGGYYSLRPLNITQKCGEIPYTNPLDNITSIRILPDGNINICRGITIGNIYNDDIIDILKKYNPNDHIFVSQIMSYGIQALVDQAYSKGLDVQLSNYYGVCDLCSDCINYLEKQQKLD